MILLFSACTFFILIHFLIAGTRLRDRWVAVLGETKFRVVFSVMAALGLAGMVLAYSMAETSQVWNKQGLGLPVWIFYIGNFLAVFLLVVGTLTPSPNSILTEKASQQGRVQITGILRITRHPGMLGIGIWALLHILASGDSASIMFFGALALQALLGPISMDRKKLRLEGERYARIVEQTSYLPFMAQLREKKVAGLQADQDQSAVNPSPWLEIGWLKPTLAVLVFFVLLFLHPLFSGVEVW